MKRILTLLVLGVLCSQTQAQILFSQDFESGSIDPMIAIDVDGKVVHPNVANIAGPTWKVVQSSANNKQIVSTSWFNPVGVADDWIISPAIEVTQTNTFLVWEAYSPDASYRDGYQVRISTTDQQVASFTNIALTIAAEETTRKTRALRLDDYIGQTIYFAFRNNSNDKFLLYMDNIKVEVFKSVNTIVRSVSFEKYNPVSTKVPIKVLVENHGGDPLTSLHLSWESGGNTYTDTISGLNVTTLNTKEFTHTLNFDITEAGEFPINISVTNPNDVEDEDPTDNTGVRTLYGLEELIPKKVVVEEGTGTWCGWCPRGAVSMDLIAAEHGDVAIPIAVHNGDPMTIANYDGPFSNSIGGYPSGHVDRKTRDINPTAFPGALVAIQNRMVPVQVKTESTYDADTRMVTIKGTGHLSIPTQANSLRFSCVITENDVTGTGTAYDQVNYYAGGANGPMGGYEKLPDPVPAAQMVYHFVARALLGGFSGMEGSIPDAVEANEEFSVEFTYEVPSAYNVENMHAIIFVLDDQTGEILNGDIVPLNNEISAVPLIPVGSSKIYPNPTSDILNLTVDFKSAAQVSMKIYNTYGGLIRDLGRLNLTSGKAFEKINVSDFQAGMYILELRHENAVTALPFTKL